MKKFLVALALAFIATTAHAQLPPGTSPLTRTAGVYFSPAYGIWKASVVSGNTATGSQTIVVAPAQVVLPDGRTITPFSTVAPLTVDMGASQEVVTPSAVSFSACPTSGSVNQNTNCALVTASFSNTHGTGATIATGDNGIEEAVNDASSNGSGGLVYWELDCGTITLNTGGVTTTSTCLVPTRTLAMGGSSIVKTTITTTATYGIGVSGSTSAFITACSSLTAGTNCAAFQTAPGAVNGAAGLNALLITANAASGAGAIHVKVWGYVPVQSAN